MALATPAGESAIGVVRVSGPAAILTVAPLLRGDRPLSSVPSHAARLVTVIDPLTGDPIDEALCMVLRGPHSYTGDDTVELSCHGSPALLRMVIDRLIAAGARLAEPGEFTRRAFLNGRIDLARAEAVALLIGARTERAVALAARALGGGLSEPLTTIRERLLDLVARLEVVLDFPDDEIPTDDTDPAGIVRELREEVGRHLVAARAGHLVHAGLTIAIVGAPNAGKSSLLNALVGRDRAIVSPEAGTTRDVVETTIVLAGIPLRLLDTAGLGEPRDAIDAESMRRSRAAIEESDLLLVVLDGSVAPAHAVLVATAGRARVLVRAKSDLASDPLTAALPGAVPTSVTTPGGTEDLVAQLRAEIERRAGPDGDEAGIVASLRQVELLDALASALGRAEAALKERPLEAALVDLKEALGLIAELLGHEVGDTVLDRVFSKFCLGK